MGKSVVIFGATGLVGASCVAQLLDDPACDAVHVVGRRGPERRHAKLTVHQADLDNLDQLAALKIGTPDAVLCCLGTTIAKAGSQDAFRRVDFTYVVNAARYAKVCGAPQFLVVTAVGSDPASSVFYSRVKGEVEKAVTDVGPASVTIFRPSLILGPRQESRLKERIAKSVAQALAFAMVGGLSKYRPIHADTIARAMLRAAAERKPGMRVCEYDEMVKLAVS